MGVGQQLSTSKPRYRFEAGRWCIDLKLKSARHLFDNRDPAPFRERELDAEAVEYVLTSVAEIGKQPLSLVLSFEEAEATLPPEVVKDAIAAHLRYEIEKAGLRLSTHWRRARYLLITGLSVEETAEVLGVSTPTVKRDWAFAKAWLRENLDTGDA